MHALANENQQRLDNLLPRKCIHVVSKRLSKAAELVIRLQPDAIFHVAAVYAEPVSLECINSMIQGNLVLGATLLYAATKCAVRPAFINTGTYWQFAADSSYSPNTLYAATKQGFQDILYFYQTHFCIPSTTLVLYDVFGKDDNRPKLWNRITKAAPGTHIPLSRGTQEIYLVHIDDVVDAFLYAADKLCRGDEIGRLYSVCGEKGYKLRDLMEQFNEASGLNLKYGWGELPLWPGVVQKPWRGKVLPGWSVQKDVIEALVELVRYARPKVQEGAAG